MPGLNRTEGSETEDQVAKTRSLHPPAGPEPACDTPGTVAGRAVRDWVNREYQKHWRSIPGQKRAKDFLNQPSTDRTIKLLEFRAVQIRLTAGLLTGHCYLRRHLFN
jgi:hypothetical protein